MNLQDLNKEFDALSETDKMQFFKEVMPSLLEMCRNDPGKMMNEMMPMGRSMMQSSGMDMEGMRRIMRTKVGNNDS